MKIARKINKIKDKNEHSQKDLKNTCQLLESEY